MEKDKPIIVVDQALIGSFLSEYALVMTEDEADEVFDYAKLRDYFGLWILSTKDPDPLPVYIKYLTEQEGFQFRMSYSGDPALFLRRIHKQMVHYCPSLEVDSLTPDPSPGRGEEEEATIVSEQEPDLLDQFDPWANGEEEDEDE